MGIAINDNYAFPLNFTSLSGETPAGYCNLTVNGGGCQYINSYTTPYLIVPSGKSIRVTLNLTGSLNSDTGVAPFFVGTGQQIDIKVLTSLTNIFEETYRLPIPVISYSSASANLGNNIQQDSIVLDGSQSSSVNATIVNWNWTLSNDTAGDNCLNPGSLVSNNFPSSGKIVRFSPPSSGPFCANLTVTDSNGMVATSPYQFIPENDQFVPPSSIRLDYTSWGAHILNITVLNIKNTGVANQPVSYSITQYSDSYPLNLTLVYPSNTVSQTDANGNVTYSVIGNGTVAFSSGQLTPKSITFVNNGA